MLTPPHEGEFVAVEVLFLEHAGSISAEEAKKKAELEFKKYDQQRRRIEDAQAESGFTQQVDELAKKAKQLAPPKRKPKRSE